MAVAARPYGQQAGVFSRPVVVPARRRRRVVFFGTYDARLYQRVLVLREGLEALGDEVIECNVPLRLGTRMRVRMLRRPWLLPLLIVRLASAWTRLLWQSRGVDRPDLVIVGYMGHFDVHLARLRWRRATIVLDQLVFAADTARDRRASSALILRLLRRLDRAALRCADVTCVDTRQHLELVEIDRRESAVVVPVGASRAWFHEPAEVAPLRVIFFGSFTPLQGATVIGEAIGLLGADASIRFTVLGRGQDYEAARAAARRNPNVSWIEWVEPEDLPALVAAHDVGLGIFGATAKGLRVVPTKVYQCAAAGLAIVTSDSVPQRRAFDGAAVLVPPGDAAALAAALQMLARDPAYVGRLRRASFARARQAFDPSAIADVLSARLPRPEAPSRLSPTRRDPLQPLVPV